MKTMKRLGCLLLVVAMCLALGVSAMAAAGETYTVTIENVQYSDQQFGAYQIFSGTVASDGATMSDIKWGSGTVLADGADETASNSKGQTVYEALAEIQDPADNTYPFEGCSSAADVAAVLNDYAGDTIYRYSSEVAVQFADVMAEFLSEVYTTSDSSVSGPDSDGYYTYTISGLTDGYYLIKNTDDNSSEEQSEYLLKVVGSDQTIEAKEEVPTIKKEIFKAENVYDTTGNYSIGDTITYVVTATVPDVRDYNNYYFNMYDSMAKGLDFQGISSIKITSSDESLDVTLVESKIGDGSDTEGNDQWYYVVTSGSSSSEDGTQIEVVLNDFLQYYTDDLATGTSLTVTITYTAILTADAIVGIDPNTNSVYLEHPTNPNYEYGGGNIPGPYEPTGTTPPSKTYVYTTGIELVKTDEEGNVLTGAEFRITGEGVNVVVVETNTFVEDSSGTYYKLTDGSYTEEAPTGDPYHDSFYVDTATTYTMITTVETMGSGQTSTDVKAFVDDEGHVKFSGLGAGEYTITETTVPEGYNSIDDITVTITWTDPNTLGGEYCGWSAEVSGAGTASVDDNGLITITIENHSGVQLPGTGGIGTTIFYVIGAVLVCGAVVLLVTKRRVNNNQPEA